MIYVVLAVSIFIGDLLIKNYIEKNKEIGKEEPILKGQILVTKYHNKGAMLNFLEKKGKTIVVISSTLLGILLVAVGFLLKKRGYNLLKLGLSFIVGGAASNVYDRFKRGYVVDYFSFKWFNKVIFNLSDLFIFLGAILTAIYSYCIDTKNG